MKHFIVLSSFLLAFSLNAQNLVKQGESVKKLAGDFKFTEGPIADAKGDVYFADIPPRIIYKWNTTEGLSVFMSDVLGCNGLFFDGDSNLVVCGNSQGQNVWLAELPSKNIQMLATEINGVKYNGPNDVWVDKKGGIYFTDPLYGKRDDAIAKLSTEGVYYIKPGTKEVIQVISDFVKPNGIIGSVNGKLLYVADIGAKKVYTYKMQKDGTLTNKKLFASEACDGMTMDIRGNLYFTNGTIMVYNKKGKKVEEIEFPESPSNVCFGGKDRKTLYVTARTGFYSLEMNVEGVY